VLQHLSIRDFVIVDSLDLEFGRGFTSLTGETGAGKSILIDALALALGERADPAQVRQGAERADITAEFATDALPALARWLEEQALEGDHGRLILRRVVDAGGRSRAFINGRSATAAQMREAGDSLVDIHGQHAHQSLVRADAQRELLDAHAGIAAIAREVGDAYREWQRLAKDLAEHEINAAARDAEREQIGWQVDELSRLGLVSGEWDALQAEHSRLAHAASLIEGVRSAVDALSDAEDSASTAVGGVASRVRSLLPYDAALGEPLSLLDTAQAQLEEAVHSLRRYADRVELDPERLREVDERLQAAHSIARRLRVRPEDLTDMLAHKRARLAELEAASNLEELARREQAAGARYRERAAVLTAERKKAAAKLSRDVTGAMKELAMAGAKFEAALVASPPEGSLHGNETIEFRVAANAGGEPRPLARVASGGELSRISLAIQVITSRAAAVPTLIFDEVDAGIGGAVAEVVGRKLRALGAERQVLCVTHLPQVAAQANAQWSVTKAGGREVSSRVAVLDPKARVEEIARMLGGVEITATTRRHAAEMLGQRQVVPK